MTASPVTNRISEVVTYMDQLRMQEELLDLKIKALMALGWHSRGNIATQWWHCIRIWTPQCRLNTSECAASLPSELWAIGTIGPRACFYHFAIHEFFHQKHIGSSGLIDKITNQNLSSQKESIELKSRAVAINGPSTWTMRFDKLTKTLFDLLVAHLFLWYKIAH